MSSNADPYYTAADEVAKAIKSLEDMHAQWKTKLKENAASSRFQELHAEIIGELQQLNYDLQDINATIDMVVEHRNKFQIDDSEIAKRKAFVQSCEQKVQKVKDSVKSPDAQAKIDADSRKAKSGGIRDEDKNSNAVRENDRFLNNQRQEQQQIIRQQDEALSALSDSVKRLGDTATTINVELKEQQQMLEELDEDIDKETEKLNFVMKKVGRLLQTSDTKQLCVIIALFVLLLGLLFLVINT